MAHVGRWLGIKCFKHNGTVHRIWDRGFVLQNDDDYVVIASKRAKVVENNGRRWFTKEPAITIFSKKEWWNVICMLKDNGICYYCNIASPCIVGKENINYIDYDLDTKLFPTGEIKVLDEKEYRYHKEQFNYGNELDTVLRSTTNEIVSKMKNREFPFVDSEIQHLYNKFLKFTRKNND